MTFRCGIKQASCRSCCRMEALNAIDKFLRGAKEEIRFVTDSLGSDRVAVMVKPVIWWKTMDKHFKAEMKKTYAKMKDVKVV